MERWASENDGCDENEIAQWFHQRRRRGQKGVLSLDYKAPEDNLRHGHIAPIAAAKRSGSGNRSKQVWESSAQPAGIPEYDALHDRHVRATRAGRFLRHNGKAIAYQKEVQRAMRINRRHRREQPSIASSSDGEASEKEYLPKESPPSAALKEPSPPPRPRPRILADNLSRPAAPRQAYDRPMPNTAPVESIAPPPCVPEAGTSTAKCAAYSQPARPKRRRTAPSSASGEQLSVRLARKNGAKLPSAKPDQPRPISGPAQAAAHALLEMKALDRKPSVTGASVEVTEDAEHLRRQVAQLCESNQQLMQELQQEKQAAEDLQKKFMAEMQKKVKSSKKADESMKKMTEMMATVEKLQAENQTLRAHCKENESAREKWQNYDAERQQLTRQLRVKEELVTELQRAVKNAENRVKQSEMTVGETKAAAAQAAAQPATLRRKLSAQSKNQAVLQKRVQELEKDCERLMQELQVTKGEKQAMMVSLTDTKADVVEQVKKQMHEEFTAIQGSMRQQHQQELAELCQKFVEQQLHARKAEVQEARLQALQQALQAAESTLQQERHGSQNTKGETAALEQKLLAAQAEAQLQAEELRVIKERKFMLEETLAEKNAEIEALKVKEHKLTSQLASQMQASEQLQGLEDAKKKAEESLKTIELKHAKQVKQLQDQFLTISREKDAQAATRAAQDAEQIAQLTTELAKFKQLVSELKKEKVALQQSRPPPDPCTDTPKIQLTEDQVQQLTETNRQLTDRLKRAEDQNKELLHQLSALKSHLPSGITHFAPPPSVLRT